MTILHISNDFSNTKVHSNLYKELDSLGVNQIVFNPIRISKRDTIGRNEFTSKHTQFVYADVVKSIHHYMYHVKRRCVYKALLKSVDVAKINLVHATTLMSDGGIAYLLYHKYNLPYVVAVRNTDINDFLDKMPHTWHDAKKILINANKIIFISQALKDKFENHHVIKPFISKIKDKLVLIPNGIDDYFISNIQRMPREGNKVIYIGDFSNNKNIIRLGNAILSLRKEHEFKDVTLTIVGGGNNEDDRVEKMIKANPEAFNYVGRIYEKDKLCSLMGKHRVFAMPSITETFGLVYIEALSQNLPVLYTKGQGIDGLFDGTIGIGVNPLSLQDIMDALRKLLHKGNEYNNVKIDFDCFKWSEIAQKYCRIYQDSLGCAISSQSLLTFLRSLKLWANPLYRIRKNKICFTAQIGSNTHLRGSNIGKYVYIGSHSVINYATIGNYSCIASTADIGGMEHPYWYPSISPTLSNEFIFGNNTKIGNDVWIGSHVCVKQGVCIGDGAVIGAGSVVTHDIPAYSIAYGVPAKVVKKRFENDEIEKYVKDSKFWELPPQEARRIVAQIGNMMITMNNKD